ncbi:DUF5686 and carboxypeptidase-like regulatory domain-containing protein [Mucilaginibacter gynuensis]|uniref:DUF5686 and carboxypeptidase-like regulatory domain-containing protein n=1 Tax=Mucilaginibacter gynuensis TaxID=1302236 RepID=A0ABP8FPU8_9SPHI
MRYLLRLLIISTLFFIGATNAWSQKIALSGKIVDAATFEPVSYATISVKGTTTGTRSDFDGSFHLTFTRTKDSVTITCVGYREKSVYVSDKATQNLTIRLQPSAQTLQEVRVGPKGYINPAWAILREIVKHKATNDPANLQSYQYKSYNRIELDASHLSDKLLRKKFIGQALSLADSLNVTDADHVPVLPLFLSETISNYYYRKSPEAKKEDIIHTRTKGIGFEDGTLLAQLTGSTFQQYNFYKNFVSAAGKDFVSPITDSWKGWYDYELDNRDAMVGDVKCFQISFKPKRPQDLAFTGTIWVVKDTYALYRIKATVQPASNLNFINQIKIEQQMGGNGKGPLLPNKTRILVEVDQLTKNSTGFLAKLYTTNTDITTGKTYGSDFFKKSISVADDAQAVDEHFWDTNRPDSITAAEKSVYHLIDTVKSLPTVKNYLIVADLLINGYYRAGKISYGPFLNTFSVNNVEGPRFRLGFRTNSSFDKKWILGGYVAYGMKDKEIKFGASVDYILSRKHWTEAGISYSHDLNQVALLSDSYLYQRNNLFAALTRFGPVAKRKPFDQDLITAYISRDLFKGFTEKVTLSNWSLDPLFAFRFQDNNPNVSQKMVVSELQLETKWSPGSQPLISETVNRPLSVKSKATAPVFTFRYTLGFKNFLGSDINYQKFSVNVIQTLKTGRFGRGKYSFSAGYIPSTVPFPLLENHLGNETALYNPNAFNLMHFFEFASDKYANLSYTQHFEGLLLNEIPFIAKLKWRLVGTANVLYGDLSSANRYNINQNPSISLSGLGSKPYIETGYGVENIFKFLRVDFIHRITYRDHAPAPDVNPKNFGIKVSAQLRL